MTMVERGVAVAIVDVESASICEGAECGEWSPVVAQRHGLGALAGDVGV